MYARHETFLGGHGRSKTKRSGGIALPRRAKLYHSKPPAVASNFAEHIADGPQGFERNYALNMALNMAIDNRFGISPEWSAVFEEL
jgi:hypothetical protein